jgi:hypothetical protein
MQNLLTYTDSHINVDPPLWANIPADRWDTLAAKFKTFETAQDRAVATPTHQNNNDRNEAQAECTRELRGFVNQFLRFPPVNNGDRIAMGIPNHDTIRTDHTVVTEMVDFVLHLRNIREILVDFWIQGESHKAKPQGYDGAVIVWDLLDAHPENPNVLNNHTMASRTPFAIHFDETERGKTVYVACAWQNERGILGQWSEIKTAIVP